MESLGILDVSIIFLFLGFTLWIGLRSSRKVKTLSEYAIGNRNFSDLSVFCVVAATLIGGTTVIGYAGEIREMGVVQCLRCGTFLGFILASIFIAPRITKFYGCLTIGDMLAIPYGSLGRFSTGIINFAFSVLIFTVQLVAIGSVIGSLINIPYKLSMIICAGIMLIYTGRGGIRAVTFTDIFQFIVLIVAIPMLACYAVKQVGGLNALVAAIPGEKVQIFSSPHLKHCWLSIAVYTFFGFTPIHIQRLLLTNNAMQGVRSHFKTAITEQFISMMVVFIGLASIILCKDLVDANQTVPYLIKTLLPVGLKGFAIAGILAVVMSTADAYLNTASITCINDIVLAFGKTKSKAEKQLQWARMATYILGIMSVYIASFHKSIAEVAIFSMILWMPTVLVPLLFVLFNRKASKGGLCITMAVGLGTSILWTLLKPIANVDGVFPGFIASLITFTLFYFIDGRQKIFENVKEEGLLVALREERVQKKIFDEEESEAKSNVLIGLFLLFTQVFPMMFLYGAKSSMNAFLTFANGCAVILFLFGARADQWNPGYKKHFAWFRQVVLLLCLPVTATYLLFTTGSGWLHWVGLWMSLIVYGLTSKQHYGKVMGFGAFYLFVITIIFHFSGQSLVMKDVFHWGYSFYFFSFIMMIALLIWRTREMELQHAYILQKKEVEHMQERYDLAKGVAHDVLAPLLALKLAIKENQKAIALFDEESRKTFRESISDMTQILESLVYTRKYEERTPQALYPLIERCLQSRRYISSFTTFDLVLKDPIDAKVEPLMFRRVFDNLLSTLLPLTPKGIGLLIEIGRNIEGNSQITIKDKSRTFTLKELNEAFERNSRMSDDAEIGVGISGFRKIIESWNGKLIITSHDNTAIIQIIFPKA